MRCYITVIMMIVFILTEVNTVYSEKSLKLSISIGIGTLKSFL